MTHRGVCLFCRAPMDYQIQRTIDGADELVPIAARICVARPGNCRIETRGDRMVADLAKRNSRRRTFRR